MGVIVVIVVLLLLAYVAIGVRQPVVRHHHPLLVWAGRLVRRSDDVRLGLDRSATSCSGVGGGIVGSILFRILGWGGDAGNIIVGVIGAVVIVLVARLLGNRSLA